jgi:hypothetical protein
MQPQQMTEDRAAEHGVDPVPAMENKILPKPAQAGIEQHEHHQADGNGYESAFRLMHDNLVDDYLREEGSRETEELNKERRK